MMYPRGEGYISEWKVILVWYMQILFWLDMVINIWNMLGPNLLKISRKVVISYDFWLLLQGE